MRKSKKITSAILGALATSAFAITGYAGTESSGGAGEYLPMIAIAAAIVAVAVITIISMVVSSNKKKAKAAQEARARAAAKAAENAKPVTEIKPAAQEISEPIATEEAIDDDAVEVETEDSGEAEINYEAPVKIESVEIAPDLEENIIEIPVVDVEDKTAPKAEEDVKIEAEVVETEAPAERDADLKEGEFRDPETGCIYTYDENGIPVPPEGMIIRYKWSFLGRLVQSDNTVKYRYMMLRRLLLSYKKVRSSVSWNFDSYFLGRKPIAKIKVRGKHVVIYFNLDPASMVGTKYAGEDVSKVARYKAVPFAYKVNGERKLQYAMELIRMVMEDTPSVEPSFIEPGQAKYAVPAESFESLFNGGYIRIGGFLAVNRASNAVDDDDDDDAAIDASDSEDDDSTVIDENVTPIEKEDFGYVPNKK